MQTGQTKSTPTPPTPTRAPPSKHSSHQGRRFMDVIKLLKEDHQRVKKMLDELEETTERATKKREDLFAEVQAELRLHELVEEDRLPRLPRTVQVERHRARRLRGAPRRGP